VFFTNQRRGASYRSSSLRKCYLCLFAIMICITIDHIHVTIFICTFFICPKKVPKKGHPKKPLLTEFVRSFEKFGPRTNFLRTEKIDLPKASPKGEGHGWPESKLAPFHSAQTEPAFLPEFSCIRSLASEGTPVGSVPSYFKRSCGFIGYGRF